MAPGGGGVKTSPCGIYGKPRGMSRTDGRNPFAPRNETMAETIVGICRGIILPGVARCCRISSIHSMADGFYWIGLYRAKRKPCLSFGGSLFPF